MAGRGPTGEDEPRACAHLPGSIGTDEESGDTLSAARLDLKTFTGPDLSVTRLAYMCGIQLVAPRSAADACSAAA